MTSTKFPPRARIRIRCRTPVPPAPTKTPDGRTLYPLVGVLPGWSDVDVFAVLESGEEVPLDGVATVEWRAAAGTRIPTAKVTFLGPDLDVDALVADDDEGP